MAITATTDRFEGDVAVLLVGEEATRLNVPRSNLPVEAEQGGLLRLEAQVDREETERRREDVRARIEWLKRHSENM